MNKLKDMIGLIFVWIIGSMFICGVIFALVLIACAFTGKCYAPLY